MRKNWFWFGTFCAGYDVEERQARASRRLCSEAEKGSEAAKLSIMGRRRIYSAWTRPGGLIERSREHAKWSPKWRYLGRYGQVSSMQQMTTKYSTFVLNSHLSPQLVPNRPKLWQVR